MRSRVAPSRLLLVLLLLMLQAFKASGQSPFEVDADLLAREQPGLILTQVLGSA